MVKTIPTRYKIAAKKHGSGLSICLTPLPIQNQHYAAST